MIPARSVTTNRDWVTTARGGLRRRVLAEHVRPVITLTSTATFAVAGDTERLSGTLAPARRGQRVLLQRRVGPRWITVKRPRVGPDSVFSIPHRFTTGRNEQWRAMVPTTIRNLGSAS